MLKIQLGSDDNVIEDVDVGFDNEYEDAWLEDDFVKSMIESVDDSRVLSARCIENDVLGMIPPTDLSGGVKALILMYKTDEIIYATNCGDNCAEWIMKIAEKKDLTICLEHYMEFPDNVEALVLNYSRFVKTNQDLQETMLYFSSGVKVYED